MSLPRIARLAPALVVSLSLGACGGPGADEFGESAGAATLVAPGGQLKLKDKGTRNAARTRITFASWLLADGGLEASVGAEPFDAARSGRSGRIDWHFDERELARVLAGAQPHLLAEADGDGRAFASFDVVPQAKVGRGALALQEARVLPGADAMVLVFAASAEVTAVTSTAGEATRIAGLPRYVQWQVPMLDVARAVLKSRALSLKATVGGKAGSTSVTFTAAASSPVVQRVPADFDLAFAALAEDPSRKLGDASDEGVRHALAAVAEALRGNPALNLNVSRVVHSADEGLTVLQGHGALVRGRGTRTESWWLPAAELRRALTRAAGGLPVLVRSEGEGR